MKTVILAAPFSEAAAANGFLTTGCWIVGLTNDPAKATAQPRQLAMYEPDMQMEALRYADSLSEPWSPAQEFPLGFKPAETLKTEIIEFCDWLEKTGIVPEDGPSLLPNGDDAVNCTNSAHLIADKFGGVRAGYFHSENPVVRGELEGGHDFALVGPDYMGKPRFLVDWQAKITGDAETFVFDRANPVDAAKIIELYGEEKQWAIEEIQQSPIEVYHALKVKGETPEGFTPGGNEKKFLSPSGEPTYYVKVAEVPGRDLALALKMTSHRPIDDPTSRLHGEVEPWHVHSGKAVLPGFLIFGGAFNSGLPGGGKDPARALPNEIVTSGGVDSGSRQTHKGDVAVMAGIAYAMPDAHTPNPQFTPLPCERVAAMLAERRAREAAQYLPAPEEISTDSSPRL